MEPYYEDVKAGITIYCDSAVDVIPSLDPVEMVLTDPPWIASASGVTRRSKGVADVVEASRGISYGDIGLFDKESISLAFTKTTADMLVICGFKELGEVIDVLKPIRGCFIWHKPNGGISVAYPSPLDTAYIVWGAHTSRLTGYQHWKSGVFSYPVPTAGCISNGERILVEKNGKAAHPAQGPLALYRELLKCTDGPVLDPFMGSGTTLVAAKLLGRKAIGIEIEERYCEIAVNRLRQGVLKFTE